MSKDICPKCGETMEMRIIDLDGTNLEEQLICPCCDEQ